MKHLGVNIDHVATLREARCINEPDPLEAAFIVKSAGAHQITVHLREDRRHICDDDLHAILRHSKLPVNIECSSSMSNLISSLNPNKVTLVPENRQEITTEGGLNLNSKDLKNAISTLKKEGVFTSLFINSNLDDVLKSFELGADEIELHTGHFANIFLMLNTDFSRHKNSIKELLLPKNELKKMLENEIARIQDSAKKAKDLGLKVSAGHGLNVQNLPLLLGIDEISEFNIGHSIIARALFVGLESAIKEILEILKQ